jgi:hypothetical protein
VVRIAVTHVSGLRCHPCTLLLRNGCSSPAGTGAQVERNTHRAASTPEYGVSVHPDPRLDGEGHQTGAGADPRSPVKSSNRRRPRACTSEPSGAPIAIGERDVHHSRSSMSRNWRPGVPCRWKAIGSSSVGFVGLSFGFAGVAIAGSGSAANVGSSGGEIRFGAPVAGTGSSCGLGVCRRHARPGIEPAGTSLTLRK